MSPAYSSPLSSSSHSPPAASPMSPDSRQCNEDEGGCTIMGGTKRRKRKRKKSKKYRKK
jgi:hypothetical protein